MVSRAFLLLLSASAALVSASPIGPPGDRDRTSCRRPEPTGPPGGPPGGGPPPPPAGTSSVSGTPSAAPSTIPATIEASATSSADAISVTPTPTPTTTPSAASGPTLPTLPGTSQLPQPTSTLKYVAVGHGIQNYTCAAASGAGASTGALAVLYDITAMFPGSGAAAVDQATWDALSADILHNTPLPLNLAAASSGNASTSSPNAASASAPFPAPPTDVTLGGQTLKFLAHHYFDAGLNPTFELSGSPAAEKFVGKKNVGITAPSTADAGLDPATGAVAWLQLGSIAGSSGLSTVYRVVTAGGNSEPCTAVGQQFSVPYAAQYWFYA